MTPHKNRTQQTLILRRSCIEPHGPDKPQGKKSGEYLLFERDGNIKGWSIEQEVHGADGSVHFKVWESFPTDAPHEAKEVLVTGGRHPERMDELRWVTSTQRDVWELNNERERIRIKDAHGTVVAEHVLVAHTCDVLPPAPKKTPSIKPPPVSAAAGVAFGEVR